MELTAWNIIIAYIPILSFVFGLYKFFGNSVTKKIDEKMDKVMYEERVKSEKAVYDEKFKVYDEKFKRFEDKIDAISKSQEIIQNNFQRGLDRIEKSMESLNNKIDLRS